MDVNFNTINLWWAYWITNSSYLKNRGNIVKTLLMNPQIKLVTGESKAYNSVRVSLCLQNMSACY